MTETAVAETLGCSGCGAPATHRDGAGRAYLWCEVHSWSGDIAIRPDIREGGLLRAAAPDLLAACEAYQGWTDASERAAHDNSPENLVAESEAADRFENMRLAAIAMAKGEAGGER